MSQTLKSLDVEGNNYLVIRNRNNRERVGFYSSRDYLDKWCFRFLSVLYGKFNTFIVSDNLGHESKVNIVGRTFMDYAQQSRVDPQIEREISSRINSTPLHGDLHQGTGLFNPFAVVIRNPGMYNYYVSYDMRTLHIGLDEDMQCEIGFLMTESEIEKYTSFNAFF